MSTRKLFALGLLVAGLIGPAAAQQTTTQQQPQRERQGIQEKVRSIADRAETAMGADQATTTPLSISSYKGKLVRAHLNLARDSFQQGNSQEAAAHINEAVAQLRTRAGRVADQPQEDDLRKAINRLEELSQRLERQEVKDADTFRKEYAKVYDDLAWHHYRNAEKMMHERSEGSEHETAMARDRAERERADRAEQPGLTAEQRSRMREEATQSEMQREGRMPADIDRERWSTEADESVENFEAASRESGREVTPETRGVMDKLRSWSGRAIAGTGWATSEAGTALDNWGNRLRSYGEDVRERAMDHGTTKSQQSGQEPREPSRTQ